MKLELATADEPLCDFCLWPYPPAAPSVGKLRSINLLLHSLPVPGEGPGAALVHALRRGLGEMRTVWGIKQAEGRISWEFYFYDYARIDRRCSIPGVLKLLEPWIDCAVQDVEATPYFMFSLDLPLDRLEKRVRLDEVSVYVGNVGSQVSSGICYGVSAAARQLKNFYFFFDAAGEYEEIVGKTLSSIHLGLPGLAVEEVLWPELMHCQTVVVANKSDRDGVYFSRIDVFQLLWFLERMGFPEQQTAFVRRYADRLDHLRFDVGVDYRVEAGRLKIVKSAWYACF